MVWVLGVALGLRSLRWLDGRDVWRDMLAWMLQGIIPVEGLDLTQLEPGLHQLHCLPFKLIGSDGAPVRCITTSY